MKYQIIFLWYVLQVTLAKGDVPSPVILPNDTTYTAEAIHHNQNNPSITENTIGTYKIKKLSLTNIAAVLITAIANLILWYMQNNPNNDNAHKPNNT